MMMMCTLSLLLIQVHNNVSNLVIVQKCCQFKQAVLHITMKLGHITAVFKMQQALFHLCSLICCIILNILGVRWVRMKNILSKVSKGISFHHSAKKKFHHLKGRGYNKYCVL